LRDVGARHLKSWSVMETIVSVVGIVCVTLLSPVV
jgi:hypothetical protein